MPKKHSNSNHSRPHLSKHKYQQKCQHGFTNNFYYVQKILDSRRLKNGEEQVFVSWRGWPARYNSWVFKETVKPEDELEDQVMNNDKNLEANNVKIEEDNKKSKQGRFEFERNSENGAINKNSQNLQTTPTLKKVNGSTTAKDKKQIKNAKKIQKQKQKQQDRNKTPINAITQNPNPIKAEPNQNPAQPAQENFDQEIKNHKKDLTITNKKQKNKKRWQNELKKLDSDQIIPLNIGVQTRRQRSFISDTNHISKNRAKSTRKGNFEQIIDLSQSPENSVLKGTPNIISVSTRSKYNKRTAYDNKILKNLEAFDFSNSFVIYLGPVVTSKKKIIE